MKKKKPFKDYNASIEGNDYFGTIYDGMAKHEAFKKLKLGTKMFYVICRIQARSSEGKACLYKHVQEYGTHYNPDTQFVFPAAHMEMYGYKRSNGSRYLKELVDAGFIRVVEQNKYAHKVNVYEFCSGWKDTKIE